MKLAHATSLAALLLPVLSSAQNVFAHVLVGCNGAYHMSDWEKDIKLAAKYGIDAFVLNIAAPLAGNTSTQISNAFKAANNLMKDDATNFKLFFSFDYPGNPGHVWSEKDVISVLTHYGSNAAHFMVNGKPLVSTFEGPSNSDITSWSSIRKAVKGGIYFMPDWTSVGPTGFDLDLVDGAFSWNMWPAGPHDKTTDDDNAWKAVLDPAGKSYMMGVSPWFYTDLPRWEKAWFWRGDDLWYRRWEQTKEVLPKFVEIVSWNDFGESHYIGPIVDTSIVPGAEAYVNGMPHTAWLETLPYQIAAYKHAYNARHTAPHVSAGEEKIAYWYRRSPASAGRTEATGNNCDSSVNHHGYQPCYKPEEIFEDAVFAIVLASASGGTASVAIGGVDATRYSMKPGINFISHPFNGQVGNVVVRMGNIVGHGVAITAEPADGVANFNAWVGCAGFCSSSG